MTSFILSGLAFGSGDHSQDKAELAQMAKIKIEEAIKMAKLKVPGTVTKAELETEHGPLMWEIEIVRKDGTIEEVHLSAKDGKVLDH